MSFFDESDYQKGQIAVINEIERQVKSDSLNFSTVAKTQDYENDPRLCLTSVHFPKRDLLQRIENDLLGPLKKIEPGHFYYPHNCLHLTIKNVRTISDPPDFSDNDVNLARNVFANILSRHKRFRVYFYRLLLFKNSLALIGTTDEELDRIHLDLDDGLKKAGIPDNKIYTNRDHFFCNMTLVRFLQPVSDIYRQKITELSQGVSWKPYLINSVTLLTANAALNKRRIIDKWNLIK